MIALPRANAPRLVLGVFCLLILCVSAWHRGHSAESLDVRTYLQMIRAIADRGLPYWDNGPIDQYPQLVIPHTSPAHGHVWGKYSPLYPYLVTPIFRLGGLRLVSSFTYATLAPLAIATFLLARRFVRSEWYATLAAVLSILSTPIAGKSLEITAFPLMVLLSTLGAYFTVVLVEDERPRPALAALAGATWGAAAAAHVLSFPMGLAALLVIPAAPDPSGERTVARARSRAVASVLAFAAVLAPVSWLNHLRFDTYNPISYGRPPWSGPVGMSVADQLAHAGTVALVVAVAAVAAFLARRRRPALIAIAIATAAALTLAPGLRTPVVRSGAVAWGYLVDPSFLDLGAPYEHPKDGVGLVIGSWVVKSTLQATPLLVLVPLAFRGAGAKRWSLVALLAPCAALFASLVARGNMENIEALGWPWVYMRYTLPALPAMVVASTIVVEQLGLPRWGVALALVGSAVLAYVFWTSRDAMLAKRLALLALPLILGVGVFLAAALHERSAPPSRVAQGLLAATVGVGLALALGHDLRAHGEGKVWCDHWVDAFETAIPRRYGMVGYLGQFDVLLSTTATHDVEYVDVWAFGGQLGEIRPLLDRWRTDGRPAVLHYPFGPAPPSPWPDVKLTLLPPMRDVYRIEFEPHRD